MLRVFAYLLCEHKLGCNHILWFQSTQIQKPNAFRLPTSLNSESHVVQITIKIKQNTTHIEMKCVLASRKSRFIFTKKTGKKEVLHNYIDLHPPNVRRTEVQ